MTDPARVIGFLDILGAWDPALLFVMAGAVGVYGLGMRVLRRCASPHGSESAFCRFNVQRANALPASSPIDRRLVIGAAIFGVGWGLSGFCPGPALANLGALRTEALVFVPAMALGMFITQRFFGADR
jgi:uncharacterized membrane protein YedE/YeeE